MSSDWRATSIGDLLDSSGGELQTGPFGSQLHAHDYDPMGTVAVVPTSAIGRRRLLPDEVQRISRKKADELARHYLRAGDIVFARRGVQAAGLSAIVAPEQEGWLCGTGGIRLRIPSSTVDTSFLSFVLSTETTYHWIRQHAVGATMPNLNEGVVRGVPVVLPPLDEQRRIAAVLGALDDKIELNRKMNRTLEEMAQALFKSWFIDFDGHDDLVDSELGPIPRGWVVGGLSSFVELNPRLSMKRGTEAVYVEMKSLPTSGPSVSDWTTREYKGGARFQQDDTLLARITPCLENGKSALVDFLDGGQIAFGSTEYIVLRPRSGVPRVWPYCLVRFEPFRAHAIANMTGSSGRQRVAVDALEGFQLAVPPAEVLADFGAATESLFQRITANVNESRTLAALRDTLLPKLISGELRVPEAEAAVEAAT